VNIKEYWDHEWSRRIVEGGVLMNKEKFKYLVKQLWKRPYLIPLRKLEVGCGSGVHIRELSSLCKEWSGNYTGFDLSETAVKFAKRQGLNVWHGDITGDRKISQSPYAPVGPFQLFLFLDVLEHMTDHQAVAAKVRELADPEGFIIFGNVPLYRSKHETEGGFEREMDIHVLRKFMEACGIEKFDHHVYGIDGWPYMIFEGGVERGAARKTEETTEIKVTKEEAAIINRPVHSGQTWAPTPGGGFKQYLETWKKTHPSKKALRVLIRTPWENSWIPLYEKVFLERGHQYAWQRKDSNLVYWGNGRAAEPPHIVLHMWANDPGALDYYPDAKQIVFMRRYEFFEGHWLNYQWDRVSHLIFCNDWIKEQTEQIAKDRGIKLPPTHLIYNAVDLDKWTFKERGPGNKIGMACHVHPKKNLPLALQILAALPREYELHIAGAIQDDATAYYIQHVGKALGLKVKLHGHIPHSQMDQWWEDKNYCLSTSISEGNPNNVIEAMAKGIQPIVHNWPDAAPQFKGEGVFDKVSKAATYIINVHYDSSLYRKIVEDHFSLDNYRQVVSLCEKVCG